MQETNDKKLKCFLCLSIRLTLISYSIVSLQGREWQHPEIGVDSIHKCDRCGQAYIEVYFYVEKASRGFG